MSLAERVLAGERRAVGRLISLVENRDPEGLATLAKLYGKTGRAHVIGVTGPPGSGKSTLVDRLIEHYRREGKRVGVVAIDPSSPFTGGALLGDRIRMQQHAKDAGVFIRSMGSRGSLGGISRGAIGAVRVLDAMGNDIIIVETVGVGQAEVDIVRLADTVLVVAVPGLGDEVQNIKAGLMEIADIFVLNKCDRDGADKTEAELKAWLEMSPESAWQVPVVRTIAEKGAGIAEVADAAARHRATLAEKGALEEKRRRQAEHELLEAMREHSTHRHLSQKDARERFGTLAAKIARREIDPATAAKEILGE